VKRMRATEYPDCSNPRQHAASILFNPGDQISRCLQGLRDFTGIFAAAAGAFRAAAAFAADDRGDGLDDFAGLDFIREIGRHGGD